MTQWYQYFHISANYKNIYDSNGPVVYMYFYKNIYVLWWLYFMSHQTYFRNIGHSDTKSPK
jgi:hypothetical protein